jgi:hypothetical protein
MFKKRLSGTRRRLAEANPTPSQAKDYMVEIDGREGVNARDMGGSPGPAKVYQGKGCVVLNAPSCLGHRCLRILGVS